MLLCQAAVPGEYHFVHLGRASKSQIRQAEDCATRHYTHLHAMIKSVCSPQSLIDPVKNSVATDGLCLNGGNTRMHGLTHLQGIQWLPQHTQQPLGRTVHSLQMQQQQKLQHQEPCILNQTLCWQARRCRHVLTNNNSMPFLPPSLPPKP